MRKVICQFFAIIAVALIFVSCDNKKDKDAVKEVGENFLSALVEDSLSVAKQYVTPETSKQWENSVALLSDVLTPNEKTAVQSLAINVNSVQVKGDEAEAVCSIAVPFFVKEITVLHFKKVDGKWLVHEPGAIVKEVIKESTVVVDPVNKEDIKKSEPSAPKKR